MDINDKSHAAGAAREASKTATRDRERAVQDGVDRVARVEAAFKGQFGENSLEYEEVLGSRTRTRSAKSTGKRSGTADAAAQASAASATQSPVQQAVHATGDLVIQPVAPSPASAATNGSPSSPSPPNGH